MGLLIQSTGGEKLKARLKNHEIHERIAFVNVNPGDKGCITYNLVYSATMSVAEAVAFAYKLGSKDKCEDVALLLRSSIQQAFKDSEPLPWPPSADDLEVKSSDELLPSDLLKFLNMSYLVMQMWRGVKKLDALSSLLVRYIMSPVTRLMFSISVLNV